MSPKRVLICGYTRASFDFRSSSLRLSWRRHLFYNWVLFKLLIFPCSSDLIRLNSKSVLAKTSAIWWYLNFKIIKLIYVIHFIFFIWIIIRNICFIIFIVIILCIIAYTLSLDARVSSGLFHQDGPCTSHRFWTWMIQTSGDYASIYLSSNGALWLSTFVWIL